MTIDQSIPTTTAACDMGRCGSCRGVVFSLTDAHLSHCTCGCHIPAPVADDELEQLAEAEADRALESALELAHFGAEL